MLPAKFVERVLRELGPDEGGALCRALTGEPSVSVRLNAAKGLAAPSGRPIGWSSGGYWLDARPSFTLDPDFHAGRYYVQGGVVAVRRSYRRDVWRNRGRARARSVRRSGREDDSLFDACRARRIGRGRTRSSATVPPCWPTMSVKWGVGNVAVTVNDPSQVARLEGWFDAVAVDAPCSGEGMFRKSEEARTEWSEAGVALCAERQRGILREAWRALRPGGLLLYSTCTFNFTENEGVLRDFSAWAAGETEPAERIAVDPAWGVVCGVEGDFQTFRFYPHRGGGRGLFRSGGAQTCRRRQSGGECPDRSATRWRGPTAVPCRSWSGGWRSEAMRFAAVGDTFYGLAAAGGGRGDAFGCVERHCVGGGDGTVFQGAFSGRPHALALFTGLRRGGCGRVECRRRRRCATCVAARWLPAVSQKG